MKKFLIPASAVLLAAVMLISCSISVFASAVVTSSDGISVTVSELFYVFTAENTSSMQRQLTEIGETAESMHNKIINNDYLFLAVSPTLSATIFMKREENDVSRTIADLIDYSDDDMAKKLLVGSALDKTEDIKEIEKGGALFYRLVCPAGTAENQTDNRAYYVTVMNSVCYTLCLIDRGESFDENCISALDSVFDSLEFSVKSEQARVEKRRDNAGKIAFYILVPVALAAIAYISWLISRDIQIQRLENDRKRNLRKKPRR